MRYGKVLVALDFADDYRHILDAGNSLVADTTELHVITVLRPLAGYYGVGFEGITPQTATLEQEMRQHAKDRLDELGEEFGLPESQLHFEIGQPPSSIRSTAELIGADLIVLGTHGRHGLGLLLGSTASGVLHGVKCDTLVVRV